MKALPADQRVLLQLQTTDLTIARLNHQRDAHPAHQTLTELQGRYSDLTRAAVAQSAVIADIERDVARVERETAKVRDRRTVQQGRLDRNEVPLRDFSAMEHEIQRIDQRIDDLETEQLSAEEHLEQAKAALDRMKTDAKAIAADVEAAKGQFNADMGEVAHELQQAQSRREELLSRLPEDLIAEYERAGRANGVLAVIEVRDGVVVGGGADFSPAELERIRTTPADELYWGEDSGQIVVRTTHD